MENALPPKNSNLVSLERLKKELKEKKLDKLISEFGYSDRKNKKYFIILKNGNRVDFGDKRYQDFLITGNQQKRESYRRRHAKDNIDDPTKPGFWSWHLLW